MNRLDVIMNHLLIKGAAYGEGKQIKIGNTSRFLDEFTIYDPTGDGNCFFRGLSLLLHGIEEFHIAVRIKTLLFMLENIDEYDSDDVRRVAEIGCAVTYNCIEATAKAEGINIYIYDTDANMWYKMQAHPDSDPIVNHYLVARHSSVGHVYGILNYNDTDSSDPKHRIEEYMKTTTNQRLYESETYPFGNNGDELETIVNLTFNSIMHSEITLFNLAKMLFCISTKIPALIPSQMCASIIVPINRKDFWQLYRGLQNIITMLKFTNCCESDDGYQHIHVVKNTMDGMTVMLRHARDPMIRLVEMTVKHKLNVDVMPFCDFLAKLRCPIM